jgi:hypothetical protein
MLQPGFVPTSPSKANSILGHAESPKKLAQRAQLAHGVRDAEFDAMVKAEMAQMEAMFSAGMAVDDDHGVKPVGPNSSLFDAPHESSALSARGHNHVNQRSQDYDMYSASLSAEQNMGQRELAALAATRAHDGNKPISFDHLVGPTRHVRHQAEVTPRNPADPAMDTFSIGGTLSPGDQRRHAMTKQAEYAKQLERDKASITIAQPRKLLRRPSAQLAGDDGTDPFIHHKNENRAARPPSSVVPSNAELSPTRTEKSQMRIAYQEAEQASYQQRQAKSGLVFSEERGPSATSKVSRQEQERQYGEELRREMERKEREKNMLRAPQEGIPIKALPENHPSLQGRHSPVDPFFSLGENGMISALGAGERNPALSARRLEQQAYANQITVDQQAKVRAAAEANVRARRMEQVQGSPSGVMGIGQRSSAPDAKRDSQRHYQDQLQRDAQATPIVRDRILLRNRRHAEDDDSQYNSYQTARSEQGDWQEKRAMQEAYYNQLKSDGSIASVEERSMGDYERDAVEHQHKHRDRYAQQMMLTNNPTADFSAASAGYQDDQSFASVDPRVDEMQRRAAAGSAAAYARQLRDEADRTREFAEAQHEAGLGAGPKLPNPEELSDHRNKQFAYAKKLQEDSLTAKMVMAQPVDRVTMPKKDDGLGEANRAPSRKVAEYHARQNAFKALEEIEKRGGSLGDLQQGSPYKTRERCDGAEDFERGYNSTGYGANRGPNPRQQPYINEDDKRIRNDQLRKQQEYARALDQASTMKPIESSRESWVRTDRNGNGLPNDEGIRVFYPKPFPGTLAGASPQKSNIPMNAVHLGHGFPNDESFRRFEQDQPQPRVQQEFARGF